MHLIYIDDSHDQGTNTTTFAALAVPASKWTQTFAAIRGWRRGLRDTDRIFVTKELHAWKFVSGRGRISPGVVTKGRRCEIFKEGLTFLAAQDGVRLFSSINTRQEWGFERLLNRINRTAQAWDSYALLICDEGKENEYRQLVRKMSVHNPIPSRFGLWRDGSGYKNITIDRILEDPFFKRSDESYFVQFADWCAYALLRRERPNENRSKYGIDKAFAALTPICVTAANPRDPAGMGIIR